MPNQIKFKVLVGSLLAGVAALTLVAGSASAEDSGCACCKKMGSMPMPSSISK
jgi:hypothetical protein